MQKKLRKRSTTKVKCWCGVDFKYLGNWKRHWQACGMLSAQNERIKVEFENGATFREDLPQIENTKPIGRRRDLKEESKKD